MYEANAKHHKHKLDKSVSIPIELYKALRGEYFMGYTNEMTFGRKRNAWARLYNPYNSGVNLHVNVWKISDTSDSPFNVQFWFNAEPPGIAIYSPFVTCTNTAIIPSPIPKVKLQMASDVDGEPVGGNIAFVRSGEPGSALSEHENGKLIFPPGGSFMIYFTAPDGTDKRISASVSFGWWEEPVRAKYIQ